jgi:hypothetical protein
MSFARLPLVVSLILLAGVSFAQKGPGRLRVSPADQLIAPSSTLQYQANRLFFQGLGKTGGEVDVTSSLTWSSSDQSVATIDSHTGSLTSTGTGGFTFITGRSGPFVTTVRLTVSTATLTSITVTPALPSVAAGRKVQFVATGNYSDGTHHDLTDVAVWNSGTSATATISPLGFVSSRAQGGSTISAAFGGQTGSTTLTVTAPVLDFIEVTPDIATLVAPATLQFFVTGVNSDGSTQSLTGSAAWSSANASIATINLTGLVTPIGPGTIAIQATAQGKTASAQLTVIDIGVGTVSNASPVPLTPLQISTIDLDVNSPVNIQFSNAAGFSVTEAPIRIASDGTVIAAVPLYVDPVSNQISPGTVSLVLIQGAQTSAPVTINIQDLPPLSTYGTQLGQISHAFLIYEAMLHARRLNDLQSAQLLLDGSIDTTSAQTTLTTLRNGAIEARVEVDQVLSNNSTVIPWGTLPNGHSLQFDSTQLDVMDRLFAVYLTQQFASIPLGPSPRGGRKSYSGSATQNIQAGVISQLLPMMQSFSGAGKLSEDVQTSENPTETGASFYVGLSSLLLEPVAEKFAAATGLVGGLLHFQEAVDSEFQGIGIAADCNASTNCTASQAQAIDSAVTSSAVSAYIGEFSAVSHAALLADVHALTTTSQSAEVAALYVGTVQDGEIQNARDITAQIASEPAFSSISGHEGLAIGTVSISNNLGIAAAQSSLDLCCLGTSFLDISALADPSGNYELFVPLGLPGTDYSSLFLETVDPTTGTGLASEFVDLTAVNPNTPVTVPPMTGSCTDTDAGAPDGDDPDCD